MPGTDQRLQSDEERDARRGSVSAHASEQLCQQRGELSQMLGVGLGHDRLLLGLDAVGDLPVASLAARTDMHQHPAAISRVRRPVYEVVGDHPVDRARQARRRGQGILGDLGHRVRVSVCEERDRAPLLDGEALSLQDPSKLPRDVPLGVTKQLRELLDHR